ncbi:HalOD1 output domain-containing protein [Halorubrum sp. HHNYT27]|uniref:HalOD1 output domain-containing protein n=1 Tax=Halorubrum sp. HHNYT27 TaxID=3402275 RepID=UPI003EBA29C3
MDADSPSESVIQGISEAEGVDEESIDPLFNTIDPDALDQIFRNLSNGPNRTGGKVEFTHEGYDVTVWADGGVSIEKS